MTFLSNSTHSTMNPHPISIHKMTHKQHSQHSSITRWTTTYTTFFFSRLPIFTNINPKKKKKKKFFNSPLSLNFSALSSQSASVHSNLTESSCESFRHSWLVLALSVSLELAASHDRPVVIRVLSAVSDASSLTFSAASTVFFVCVRFFKVWQKKKTCKAFF